MSWANIASGLAKNNKITIANKQDIEKNIIQEDIVEESEHMSVDDYYTYFIETKLFDTLVNTMYKAQTDRLEIAKAINTSDLLDFFSNYVDYDLLESRMNSDRSDEYN